MALTLLCFPTFNQNFINHNSQLKPLSFFIVFCQLPPYSGYCDVMVTQISRSSNCVRPYDSLVVDQTAHGNSRSALRPPARPWCRLPADRSVLFLRSPCWCRPHCPMHPPRQTSPKSHNSGGKCSSSARPLLLHPQSSSSLRSRFCSSVHAPPQGVRSM